MRGSNLLFPRSDHGIAFPIQTLGPEVDGRGDRQWKLCLDSFGLSLKRSLQTWGLQQSLLLG